jgi:hypothetical protein
MGKTEKENPKVHIIYIYMYIQAFYICLTYGLLQQCEGGLGPDLAAPSICVTIPIPSSSKPCIIPSPASGLAAAARALIKTCTTRRSSSAALTILAVVIASPACRCTTVLETKILREGEAASFGFQSACLSSLYSCILCMVSSRVAFI